MGYKNRKTHINRTLMLNVNTKQSASDYLANNNIRHCSCCGGTLFANTNVLWPSLVREWQLSPDEESYVNRQQGLKCSSCGVNLRSMALAKAIMMSYNYKGLFKNFVRRPFCRIRLLEINEAGNLSKFLRKLRCHTLARYPEVDMLHMPYDNATFDIIVHSDTLEHVQDPISALRECRRVLRRNGICAYTVPIIVGRMTTSREGKSPSYHGEEGKNAQDYKVITEYGADAWTHPMMAGFRDCRLISAEFPAAQAIVARNITN